MFDFKKPPINGACLGAEAKMILEALCPEDYTARCKFYDIFLIPFGHARGNKNIGWWFSKEYLDALHNKEDLKMLQAMMKMIQ
jgi:hypothetical protein